MTDVAVGNPVVEVTINETPVYVTIDNKNPVINITDNGSTVSTVTQAQPQVTVTANDDPTVQVFLGGTFNYNQQQLLSLLDNALTKSQFELTLQTELSDTADSLILLAAQDALLRGDVDTLDTNFTVLDGQVQSIVSSVSSNDGDISILQSRVTQTENDIVSSVGRLDLIDGDLLIKQTAIDQNASDILLQASTLSTHGDDISAAQASIALNAGNISTNVTNITTLDGRVTTTESRITQTESDIALNVTSIDNAQGRIDAAEILIDANSISLSVINDTQTAQQEMFADRWSVQITEDASGRKYSTGFSLSLHEVWYNNGRDYVIDEMVWYNNASWICIANHTSTTLNYPGSVPGASLWAASGSEAQSSFVVQADEFEIRSNTDSANIVSPFKVSGDAVTIDGSLIADSISSSNYVAGTSGFTINTDTGIVEFNEADIIFNSVTSVRSQLNVSDGADNTKGAIESGTAITTGYIDVNGQAGINGTGTADTSVRFWAGTTYANRANAPWIVYKDGSMRLRSATTGERMEITDEKIEVYDASNNLRVRLGKLS